MNTKEILSVLTNEIHSTVFATIDENGLPQTCVIDLMLCDDDSIYFLTAKGKNFYKRLKSNNFVAISGMKGSDTLSTVAISLRGKVEEIGTDLLNKIFEVNPYMKDIYPKEESRAALTVFQLYEGEGEYFDLSQLPPKRQAFTVGGKQITKVGYSITDKCLGCGACFKKCPSNCIEQYGKQYRIRQENCIRCGTCFETCRSAAIIRY